jgi:hypothetical protein
MNVTTKPFNDSADLPSRRAMLTALATAPVAGVPMVAAVAASEPDPIFAMIKFLEQAQARADEASDGLNLIYEEVGLRPKVTVTVCGVTHTTSCREDLEKWLEPRLIGPRSVDLARWRLDKIVQVSTRLKNEGMAEGSDEWDAKLAELTNDDPREVERDRAVALAKFDEAKQAYDTKCEIASLKEAERRADELSDMVDRAQEAVMRAQPRTVDGVRAYLMFAAEYAARYDGIETALLTRIFVNAARAIAGPAAKLELSEQLQELLTQADQPDDA